MQTRGIPRSEAVRVLVEGYFEPVVDAARRPGRSRTLVRRADRRQAGRRRGPGRASSSESALEHHAATQPLVDVRADFPILGREFDGRALVYLDSAATSQKPEPVIEAIDDYYRELQRQHPPRRLHARPGGDRPVRGRARADRRVRRRRAARRRSSPATPPRRSTSSPTRGAATNVGAGDEVLITADGAPLEHRAVAAAVPGDRRQAALPRGRRRRASCRSTSSTPSSPTGA